MCVRRRCGLFTSYMHVTVRLNIIYYCRLNGERNCIADSFQTSCKLLTVSVKDAPPKKNFFFSLDLNA